MLTQLFGLHFLLNKYKFRENQEKITSRKCWIESIVVDQMKVNLNMFGKKALN